jgi:hypothetical protein
LCIIFIYVVLTYISAILIVILNGKKVKVNCIWYLWNETSCKKGVEGGVEGKALFA